ncbi:MAG TPA: sigma-70 family RNA polymerase sigma factor [Pyrinomonadaceae bacterium]|nr:sigma-70 family RNA polymerase sigma factor [Pyrinomonadaceae bacterium]
MEISCKNQRLDPTSWLEAHGEYLFRFALARVRDKAVAEDLLQETLLAAIGACHTHAGRSSERTWLVGIMKHKAIDHLRRIARTTQFQSTLDADEDLEFFENAGPRRGHWRDDRAPLSWHVDAARLLESREFWETFNHCLSQLPQPIAIAFTLREIDGLESNEICEILNVTPNNLWVMLHRGRTRLRDLLETEWFSHRAAAA